MSTPSDPDAPYSPGEEPTVARPALPHQPPPSYEPPTDQYDAGDDQHPEIPDAKTPQPEDEKKKPWGWIAASGALAIVALGFAIWAIGLSGDLSDQRRETRSAQRAAERAASDAKSATDKAKDAADQSNALSDQLDSLTSSLSDATDALASATADARKAAEDKIDDLRKRLEDLIGQAEDAVNPSGGDGATTP